MKVQATYQHTFEVTREVEVDSDDFEEWAADRYTGDYDRDLALTVFIENQDDEFHSGAFPDWRTDKPLPRDFEFQSFEVTDAVAPVPQNTSSEEGN